MNIFLITKTIAFITMFIDHFGFLNNLINFRIIGRISMPLFAMLMALGTRYTKNAGIRTLKLLTVALISTPITLFFFKTEILNIIFSFFIFSFLFFLIKRHEIKSNLFEIMCIIILVILDKILHVDYGAYLILLLYTFYKLNNCYIVILIFSLLTVLRCIFFTVGKFKYLQLYSLFAIPFIWVFYKFKDKCNKRITYRNKFLNVLSKNLFYILYPIHFLLLLLIDKFF